MTTSTKKMACVFASNLLSDAIFVMGEQYEANRVDGQIFLKCPIGMIIQVNMDFSNRAGSWVHESENGTYRFDLV